MSLRCCAPLGRPLPAAVLVAACALLSCARAYEVLELPDAGGADAGLASDAFSLSAGDAHTCAIRAGALWCWGRDSEGQVGDGTTSSAVLTPVRVGAGTDWVEVSAGESHTCARKADGSVWCWGSNASGQLGLGDFVNRATPTRVPLPSAAHVVQSRSSFSCAVLEDASLWCWGANTEGQLGLDDDYPGADQVSARPVVSDAGWKAVATGQGHACALRLDGSLWCWGRNTGSMVGQGGDAGSIQYRVPQRVGARTDWTQLDANQEYTCALRADQSLWCWGHFLNDSVLDAPTRMLAGTTWARVRTNLFHLCVVSSSGEASCWGRNLEGQLGLGDFDDRPDPTALDGGPVTDLSTGRFDTCLRRADGSLWCAGKNDDGQLGDGDTALREFLAPVSF
jgi:alpha-tubulin suppressor-like RCC1 family protein